MLTLAQSLMAAVLEQAVADLESRNLKIRRHALAWFLASSTRSNHIFSFPRICCEFGYDPNIVRPRVLASGPQALHQGRDKPQRAAS